MSIEEGFYSEALVFIRELKKISLASPRGSSGFPVLTLFLSSNASFNMQQNMIYKLQEWELVKIVNSKKDKQNNQVMIVAELASKFNKIHKAWEEIWDNPFFAEKTRIDEITKLLKIKKQGVEKTQSILTWNDLTLDINTGWGNYNGYDHHFMTEKPPFKVLKRLLEGNGKNVSYEEFFKAVEPSLNNDRKKGRKFICQKIRDIRKYFGLNRDQNPKKDIFSDTGNGFRLMNFASGLSKIPE